MTNFVFPTKGGIQFQHGPWKIGLWLQKDFGAGGSMFVLGHETEDGWIMTGWIDGPYTTQVWQDIINAHGGMGNYAYAKLPTINAILDNNYDISPPIPPLSNSTPFSEDNFNFVWSEFFKFVSHTDGTPDLVPK